MAPIKPETQQERIKCVRDVASILEDESVQDTSADSLSIVKGLFNRIHKQDQQDWFTVFEQLGCPGRKKSENIAANISHLRKVIVGKSDHDISEIIRNLTDLGTQRHLDLFLNPEEKKREPEKIYILSTREQQNFLKIGFTKRSVVERVNEVNSATGVVVPFGVRAVWTVKDAHKIEKIIHDKLSEYRVRKDREFFDMDFRDAFKLINRILAEERVKEL